MAVDRRRFADVAGGEVEYPFVGRLYRPGRASHRRCGALRMKGTFRREPIASPWSARGPDAESMRTGD